MRCALVENRSRKVVNMIMADPVVDKVSGHTLVADPPDWVTFGSVYKKGKWIEPTGLSPKPVKGLKTI